MTAHVTVIVPVKDRRERMLRCLEALLDLDYPAYDVLVLDNGSTDGTPEACSERAGSARVPVRVEVVHGTVGRVRNVGARLAGGEIVAYTDSDCLPSREWLRAGVEAFEDPRVGVVTGTTLPEDPPPYDSWHATLEVTRLTWHFESANLFLRREPFVATAGFDEQIGHYGEDTPAGWAMIESGWQARFAPAALVHHDVTYPGYRWHLARARAFGHVAAVVRRHPQLRDVGLWKRYFISPRHARLSCGAAGVLLALLDRRALVLAAPYAIGLVAGTERHGRPLAVALIGQAKVALVDLNALYGVLRGSLRWRTLVL